MNAQANLLHRFIRRLATYRPVTWLFARILPHLDRIVFRLTQGRQSLAALLSGLPIISLTTIGAKSGQPRTVSLVGIPVDEGLVVIASNWGQTHYPAWYHNVKASPEVKVGQNGRSATYIAREVEGSERERYWQLANQYYIGFSHYSRHASHRRIPVILLMPR